MVGGRRRARRESDDRLVAHGFFRRLYGPTAELGLVAATDQRAVALTMLLRALAVEAVDHGITRLIAQLQASDHASLAVLRRAGRTRETVEGDKIDVELLLGAPLRQSG